VLIGMNPFAISYAPNGPILITAELKR
jgi:hypothetical protein